MKIDIEAIAWKYGQHLAKFDEGVGVWYDSEQVHMAMREACKTVLDEAIKSFPSHEHPEIAKSILKIKEEL